MPLSYPILSPRLDSSPYAILAPTVHVSPEECTSYCFIPLFSPVVQANGWFSQEIGTPIFLLAPGVISPL